MNEADLQVAERGDAAYTGVSNKRQGDKKGRTRVER